MKPPSAFIWAVHPDDGTPVVRGPRSGSGAVGPPGGAADPVGSVAGPGSPAGAGRAAVMSPSSRPTGRCGSDAHRFLPRSVGAVTWRCPHFLPSVPGRGAGAPVL